MKIATWNINSIKVRLPQVLNWLNETQPDVLALQEIKTINEAFPFELIQAAGYEVIANGQKTYNGVAIISKMKAEEIVTDIPQLQDPQRRILAASVNGIRIVNLYVPNGESVVSEKYTYKLHWLKQVKDFLKQELQQHEKVVVLGDFNIAPDERDVYDPERWRGHVLFTDAERDCFAEIKALGFQDSFRLFNQDAANYTWWDYRAASFWRNWGLRIDHILVSNNYAKDCQSCIIDKKPRKLKQPSDHTPLLAEFKF